MLSSKSVTSSQTRPRGCAGMLSARPAASSETGASHASAALVLHGNRGQQLVGATEVTDQGQGRWVPPLGAKTTGCKLTSTALMRVTQFMCADSNLSHTHTHTFWTKTQADALIAVRSGGPEFST